jgi:hypothetical protein
MERQAGGNGGGSYRAESTVREELEAERGKGFWRKMLGG